jgi:hypothetical protein
MNPYSFKKQPHQAPPRTGPSSAPARMYRSLLTEDSTVNHRLKRWVPSPGSAGCYAQPRFISLNDDGQIQSMIVIPLSIWARNNRPGSISTIGIFVLILPVLRIGCSSSRIDRQITTEVEPLAIPYRGIRTSHCIERGDKADLVGTLQHRKCW